MNAFGGATASAGAPPTTASSVAALLRARKQERKGLVDIAGFTAAQGYGEELEACLGLCRDTWRDALLNHSVVNLQWHFDCDRCEYRTTGRVQGPGGRTRLSLACLQGRADRVAQLISYGADVNVAVKDWHLTEELLQPYLAAGGGEGEDGQEQEEELQPASRILALRRFNRSETLPIELALDGGHADIVRALALAPKANPLNAVGPAALLGLTDVVRELARRGLKWKADHRAYTEQPAPLLLAASGGHLDTVKVLVEAGCPIPRGTGTDDGSGGGGSSGTNIGIQRPYTGYPGGDHMKTALAAAAEAGHTAVVKYLAGVPDIDLTEVLVSACKLGLADFALSLVDRGGDVNGIGWCGWTALVEATRGGHQQLVHALLERGAKPDVAETSDDKHVLPLPLACFLGHTTIVRDLLAHGATVNSTGAVVRAAHGGHTELVRELAALPAMAKEEALWAAAYSGLTELVVALLGAGAAPTFISDTVSVLGAAAARGHVAVMGELIRAGAEVKPIRDSQYGYRFTPPLLFAAACGQVEAARLLCQHGADVNQGRGGGYIPSWLPVPKLSAELKEYLHLFRPSPMDSPMLAATAYGHSEVALLLAQQPGLDLKDALLHAVLGKGSGSVAQALLDRGADPSARDPYSHDGPCSLLTLSIRRGNPEAALVLIQHPQVQLEPALLEAVCYGHAELVRAMAARGAKLDEVTDAPALKDEFTALQAACRAGDAAVVRVLLEAGAGAAVAFPDGTLPLYHACMGIRKGKADPYYDVIKDCLPVRRRPVEQRVEILKMLTAAGADVNQHDDESGPALQMVVAFDASLTYDRAELLTVIRALLELGADCNKMAETGLDTDGPAMPVEKAAHADVVQLLCAYPTIDLQAALVAAAAHGLVDCIRDLLGRGAVLNQPDRRGHYPIVAAAAKRNLQAVRALAELGADVNAVQPADEDSFSCEVLFGVALGPTSSSPTRKPLSAIRAASSLPFKLVLAGPKEHARETSASIVRFLAGLPSIDLAEAAVAAVGADLPEVIDALAARGADFNKANAWGELPIQVAAARCLPSVVRALLRGGADPNATFTHDLALRMDPTSAHVSLQTVQGVTALMVAAAKGGAKTVQALCEGGADVGAATAHTAPVKNASSSGFGGGGGGGFGFGGGSGGGGFGWAVPAPVPSTEQEPAKPPQPLTVTASLLMTYRAADADKSHDLHTLDSWGKPKSDPQDPRGVVACLALRPGADPVHAVKAALAARLPDAVKALVARGLPGPALTEGLVEACRSTMAPPTVFSSVATAPDLSLVQAFLDAGADVAGEDSAGVTPLDASCMSGQRYVTAVATLLIRHPAIDLSKALVAAVRMGQADLVGELMQRGVDVNKGVTEFRDSNSRLGPKVAVTVTPLEEVKSVEVLRTLAEAPTIDPTAVLLKALDLHPGDAITARAMIERGADINATNKQGLTVLDRVAGRTANPDMQALREELEERGAKASMIRDAVMSAPALGGGFGSAAPAPAAAGLAPFTGFGGPINPFQASTASSSAPAVGVGSFTVPAAGFGGFSFGALPPVPAVGVGSFTVPAAGFGGFSFGSAPQAAPSPAPAPSSGSGSGGFSFGS